MKKIMIAAWETAEDRYDDYVKAMEALGAEAFVSLEESDLPESDGLILPGSCQDMNPKLWGAEDLCSNDINDELDTRQWRLMELAVKKWRPVLGICRGMQFMNVFFGGTLIQDLPCKDAHMKRTPECCHKVSHLKGTFMAELMGADSVVNSRHHQGVGNIGRNLEIDSVWDDGQTSIVEAFEHRLYPMVGVQWHPEKMFLYGDVQQRRDAEKLLRYFLERGGEQ